ncbi:unnamed protein product, partial [Ectocarpus sp. 13 AM-2016]
MSISPDRFDSPGVLAWFVSKRTPQAVVATACRWKHHSKKRPRSPRTMTQLCILGVHTSTGKNPPIQNTSHNPEPSMRSSATCIACLWRQQDAGKVGFLFLSWHRLYRSP